MTDYVLPMVLVPLMSTAKPAFVTMAHAETRPSVKMPSNAWAIESALAASVVRHAMRPVARRVKYVATMVYAPARANVPITLIAPATKSVLAEPVLRTSMAAIARQTV